MRALRPIRNLNPVQSEIIRTLIYYDVFSYPLTLNEIRLHLTSILSSEEVLLELNQLYSFGMIHRSGDYYQLEENREEVKRRILGNRKAEKGLKIAAKMTSLISNFPFVRAVMISGSLSKHFMDDKSDIDYFIITKPGRLWVARTLLILFKKIFLLNSFKYFCVNYFIDEDHLKISPENKYIAVELQTLIPTYGAEWYTPLMDANDWVKSYHPNYPRRKTLDVPRSRVTGIKAMIENLLSGKAGDKLDDSFMKLTMKYWQRKFKDFDETMFRRSFELDKCISRHHPNDFQVRVLNALESKETEFEERFATILANTNE